jgi:hypothetical protein
MMIDDLAENADFDQVEPRSSKRLKDDASDQTPITFLAESRLRPLIRTSFLNLVGQKRSRRQPQNALQTLAFMHIPKTSGMAMTDLLSRTLNTRQEFPRFDRCLFGAFNSFDTVSPALRETIHVGNGLPRAEGADFVAGHLALSTLTEICGNAKLVTLLRDPRSRVLSLWLYWRTHSDHQLAPWGDWAAYVKQAREPLATFLGCPQIACQTDNLITRMLLWPNPLIPVDNFIAEDDDRTLVAAALKALGRFAFVDTIENPDFQSNLQAWLARPLEYAEVNRTASVPVDFQSPLEKELSWDALNLLERRTRLDSQLWSAVVTRLRIGEDVAVFSRKILMRDIARFSRLIGG